MPHRQRLSNTHKLKLKHNARSTVEYRKYDLYSLGLHFLFDVFVWGLLCFCIFGQKSPRTKATKTLCSESVFSVPIKVIARHRFVSIMKLKSTLVFAFRIISRVAFVPNIQSITMTTNLRTKHHIFSISSLYSFCFFFLLQFVFYCFCFRKQNNVLPNGEPNTTNNILEMMHADRHTVGHYRCTGMPCPYSDFSDSFLI